MAASTDMGDVTQIMPASHPGMGGAEGAPHTTAFRIVDPDLAYIAPAKVLAMSAIDLLADGATTADRIIKDSPPRLSRADYLAYLQAQQVRESFRYLA